MSTSDWISILAFLVAVLSAIYARWSLNESRKANKISLQFEKVEIYKDVITFTDCFRGLFSVPTYERLDQFRQKAVNLSEIYFSDEVYKQLQEIHSLCNNSQMYLSVVEDTEKNESITDDLPSELEVRREYKSVLNLLYPVIEDMKKELKIDA